MSESKMRPTPQEWQRATAYATKLSERVEKVAPLKDEDRKDEGTRPLRSK